MFLRQHVFMEQFVYLKNKNLYIYFQPASLMLDNYT